MSSVGDTWFSVTFDYLSAVSAARTLELSSLREEHAHLAEQLHQFALFEELGGVEFSDDEESGAEEEEPEGEPDPRC